MRTSRRPEQEQGSQPGWHQDKNKEKKNEAGSCGQSIGFRSVFIRLSPPAFRVINPTNHLLIRVTIQIFSIPGGIHHAWIYFEPRDLVRVHFLPQVHTFGEWAYLFSSFPISALLTANSIKFVVEIIDL